jgi:hypothetical protein
LNTYDVQTRTAILQLERLTKLFENTPEGSRTAAASPVRHKVFVSYHAVDAQEVLKFVENNTDVFIPRAIGMEEDGSDIIDSTDVAYIRQAIKSRYLRDSTVTLVAIGSCTWARKFVDWEIYSSLRSDPKPSGLLAVQLPSIEGSKPPIPERLSKNVSSGYAKYFVPPSSTSSLRDWIQEAFDGRTDHADKIAVGGALRERNSPCTN